jgi:hypothetical protein
MRLPEPREQLLQEVSLGSIIASYVHKPEPSLRAVYITTPRGASSRYQNVPTFPISGP